MIHVSSYMQPFLALSCFVYIFSHLWINVNDILIFFLGLPNGTATIIWCYSAYEIIGRYWWKRSMLNNNDTAHKTNHAHISLDLHHKRRAIKILVIVAKLFKSLATLTLGSSKINQHCWRFHGSGVIAAPQIIGLISFCTGMHHEYFFRSSMCFRVPYLCSKIPKNKQLDWRIRHSHLACTLFHSLVPWWRPRRIWPQITRLSQSDYSAMGTWPIYKNSSIPDWFEKWRDIKFWYRC